MTTIAFDGKALAADRASWKNNNWHAVNKLSSVIHLASNVAKRFMLPEGSAIVWAGAGESGMVPLVRLWMQSGEELPPLSSDGISLGIVLDVNTGLTYELTGKMTIVHHEQAPVADGGGFEVAMGAMLAGADAKKAIELTALRSSWAAGGVDVFVLPDSVVAARREKHGW